MRCLTLAALAVSLAVLPSCRDRQVQANQAVAPGEKSDLYLLSSLPLLFGETFGLDAKRPAVVEALQARYELKPVDVASQLPDGAALLAIQPRALPAEELVRLDQWVREGGQLILLADPTLEWHSARPLGDPLRPPVMFGDTGLLQHWGLRLDAPDERGPAKAVVRSRAYAFASPGKLVAEGGTCVVEASAIVATCPIGKGRAVIVADADWLNAELVEQGGGTLAQQFDLLIELIESVRTGS